MKIFIKVLRGDGCTVEVEPSNTVADVKRRIADSLQVPVCQQSLVFLGKTLVDENPIAIYPKIVDGAKIHLMVKKPDSLKSVLDRLLQTHYTKEQVDLILDEFMRDFNERVHNLSLDDLERIATSYMNEEAQHAS